MSCASPRNLWLDGFRPDDNDSRVFEFSIENPLKWDLEVIPGQYFMLGVPGIGEAPFTSLEPPDSLGGFRALIRRRGLLTSMLFAQSPGTLLAYRGPCGGGWPLLFGQHRVLLIAADHGLIPLAPFMDEAQHYRLPRSLSLLHFTDSPRSRALEAAKHRWRAFSEVFEVPGGKRGDGDSLLLLDRILERARPQAVLCCASEVFTRRIAESCLAKGVRPEMIWLHVERAIPSPVHSDEIPYPGADCSCRNGPVHRYDRYRLYTQAEAQLTLVRPGWREET